MKRPQFNFKKSLDRRTILRGSGVAMSLPWLSAMTPSFATEASGYPKEQPKRFVAMTLGLGLVPDNLKPQGEGRTYKPSRYLEALEDLREDLTIVSGSSHPGVKGGHRAEASILTGTNMGSAGRGVNTISFDQYLAKHLGDATRFQSLVLAASGANSPCYTDSGAMIPPETSPSKLFTALFVDDSKDQRTRNAARVAQGRSIMDLVADDAKSLSRTLGSGDRNRLDAYFTSVRQLEQRMEQSELWAKRPKPHVNATAPVDILNPNDLVGRMKTMCDVIKLALATDSSRFVTLHLPGGGGVVPVEGVDQGYHSLSHHGRDEAKLEQLTLVESAIVAQWGSFLRELQNNDDASGNLLDDTTVFLTSNLGNASNHDNRNMPVLIGGGGFGHAGHLKFDQRNNYPLTNFFVSAAQQCGMEVDSFSSGTSTMDGLKVTT